MTTKFSSVQVGREFTMEAFHKEMQRRRKGGEDVTLKGMLAETWGNDYSPEKFYGEVGVNLKGMTVEKMLNTSELTRWLFPEVFRDAIRRGIEYTPFYRNLIVGEEAINSTGLTMPFMDWRNIDADAVRLRDTGEGATITEGEIVVWSEKQVSVKKKARGLKQTYESIMFTPINLAAVFFEELGTRMGADLDSDLINIAINGDQADLSESAPVIGATTINTLTYLDVARAWIRFRRLGRNSTAMLCNEADAVTILNMDEFQRTQIAGQVSPSGVLLSSATPLPTSQDIYVHADLPARKIVFVDPARAFIQLTAMPLMIESERLVSRQIQGEYVSIITGFANVFRDGRLLLDYGTTLGTNPGPTITY